MPSDTSAFTLSLFDSTALPGWTHHARQTLPDPNETDPANDDDDDPTPPPANPAARGSNYHLPGNRALTRGWAARARDNIAAIALSKALEASGDAPTPDEQAQLLRFVGFGATELAQNCFRRPGEEDFRPDWQDLGTALEAAVIPEEYAALQRATQYAHYTRRRSSGASGTPPADWVFLEAVCWNRAWAPGCSSRCCPKHYAPPASLLASNMTRSQHASRAWCIPKGGCGARSIRGVRWPGASIS
jgi:hypothetical protein